MNNLYEPSRQPFALHLSEDMSYVLYTKENFDRIERAMKDLMIKKHGIERELNLTQNRGKQPTDELQLWVMVRFYILC